MSRRFRRLYRLNARAGALLALYLLASGFAKAQVLNSDMEVRVGGLPSLMARSHDLSDVLSTSLDTILHTQHICCGKDSALGDSVAAANPSSLKDVAAKLQGRHLLSDGRPVQVTAEFWPSNEINSGRVIGALTDQNALLMLWNSQLYVVYGAVYQWFWAGSNEGGSAQTTLHKFLLLDTRYSDSRRHLEFNRLTNDLSKVQGLLLVSVKPE